MYAAGWFVTSAALGPAQADICEQFTPLLGIARDSLMRFLGGFLLWNKDKIQVLKYVMA